MSKTKWALLAFAVLAVALLASFGRSAPTASAACGAGPNCMAVDASETTDPSVQASATYAVGAPFDVSFDITTVGQAWAGYNLAVDHVGLTWTPMCDVDADTTIESWCYTGLGGTTLDAVTSIPQADRLQGGSARAGGTTSVTGEAVIARFTCDAPGAKTLHLVTSAEAVTFTTTLALGGVGIATDLDDATINCQDQSDWQVVKTDSPDPVLAAGQITYTITATNMGPNVSRGMVIFDELPNPGTGTGVVAKEFVSASVSINGGGPLPCIPGYLGVFPNPFPPPALFSNFLVCAVQPILAPVLPPGTVVTATIVVDVPIEDAGKPDVNIAGTFQSVNFGELNPTVDPNPANEADCAPLGFLTPANLGCELTLTSNGDVQVDKKVDVGAGFVDGGDSVAGATVTYQLTIHNAGPSPVTGVVVTDDLDGEDLTLVGGSASCTAGGVPTEPGNLETGSLSIAIGTSDADGDTAVDDMAVSDTVTCTYQATYDADLANVTVTNTASTDWTDGTAGDVDSVDVFVRPAAATMLKDPAEATIWLCVDWATDGVDNDGDSTVDNEAATCTGPGEGELTINEIARNVSDIDSPNDDDDGDGQTVSPAYCLQFGCPPELGALVDHNGGEIPEGLAAFEFQLKFEHKLVDLDITVGPFLGSNGRTVICTPTIITENDIRFACVSTGDVPGPSGLGPFVLATIQVLPEPDLYIRLRPGKDNGVVTRLIDENCQWADTLGDPMSATLPGGLLPFCDDSTLTIRWLEGDINGDCQVNVYDEQSEAFRYGTFFGSLWYDDWFDLQPPLTDYDIDVKDLQFVFGREGSTCQDSYPPQGP